MDLRLRSSLSRFAGDTRGATAIEYSVIAAGIACAIVALVYSIGSSVNTLWLSVSNALK